MKEEESGCCQLFASRSFGRGPRFRQWAAPFLFAWIALAAAPSKPPAPPAIGILLDMYDRADYLAVARELETLEDSKVLDRLDADLRDRAKAWIDSVDPSAQRRRAFVAGAVALELTHALVRRESFANGRFNDHAVNPEALPHVARLVADRAIDSDAVEHDWTLAQLATWQEWNATARMVAGDLLITPEPVWGLLLGQPSLFQMSRTQLAFGQGGYLGEALARFPADPRLLLALAEGRESIETRCAREYCRDEMTPAAIEDLRTRAKGRPGRSHDMAVTNLAAFDRLLPAATAFASLAGSHPEVRAEAHVHIGYLAIRAARPDAALTPLAIGATSDDPYVRYLAEYFTGRALAALGRGSEAIAAYRRALSVVPNAPSAATLLAASLLVSDAAGDRLEASNVLRAANAASPPPLDPWDWYWYGDARLWPVYMERLRQALRQ